MKQADLETVLREIPLGGLRFFTTLGSSNDEALAWAASGARDFSLVAADEQTSGRGRGGHKWFSPPGAGLAFSLVLRPTEAEGALSGRFAGLGALALLAALKKRGVSAQIKWPNDVLARGKKIAGILVEAVWTGAALDSLVLGMGVNVSPVSLPPEAALAFPATCVEMETGARVERYELLRDVLVELLRLRAGLASEAFLNAWQAALAFRGERVMIWQGEAGPLRAELLGLAEDGSLRVKADGGEEKLVHFGEVHLRPE